VIQYIYWLCFCDLAYYFPFKKTFANPTHLFRIKKIRLLLVTNFTLLHSTHLQTASERHGDPVVVSLLSAQIQRTNCHLL